MYQRLSTKKQENGSQAVTNQQRLQKRSPIQKHLATIIQRARLEPQNLSRAEVMHLHKTIGNQAVGRLLLNAMPKQKGEKVTIQRQVQEKVQETVKNSSQVTAQRLMPEMSNTRPKLDSSILSDKSSLLSSENVIQRRMGFEFETSTYIFDGNYHPRHILEDGEIGYTKTHWKMLSDDGRMEFVSNPVDNLQDLKEISKEMTTFIKEAEKITAHEDVRTIGGRDNWSITLGRTDGQTPRISKDVKGEQDPDAKHLCGNPQVSIGIEMKFLANFLKSSIKAEVLNNLRQKLRQKIASAPQSSEEKEEAEKKVSKIVKVVGKPKVEAVKGVLKKVDEILYKNGAREDVKKLRGLWTLMAFYLRWLKNYTGVGGYIKAQLPIMARTDFHSMFNTMNSKEKKYYRDLRSEFIGAWGDGSNNIGGTGFTVAMWYDSISDPTQIRRLENGEEKNVDLMSANPGVATNTNKSMGQLGIDTQNNGEKVVFELRRITGGINIPIDYLYPYVLSQIYNWVKSWAELNRSRSE